MPLGSIAETVRQPEYTGENRCIPCTIANAAIALVLSGGIAAGVVVGLGRVTLAAVAGSVVLAFSAAAIYLRGYLVPGTPELTKRYFPEWVLAKFDKAPETPGVEAGADESGGQAGPDGEEVDPERVLLDAGALQPCDREDDLCLADDFHADWRDRIDDVRDRNVDADAVLSALAIDASEESAGIERYGEAVVLERGRRKVGQWESEAALVADVAAAELLAERFAGWEPLDPVGRSKVLRGLRIFVAECPACSGPVSLGQDTVESCCRSYEVAAVTCQECGDRLFEQRMEAA